MLREVDMPVTPMGLSLLAEDDENQGEDAQSVDDGAVATSDVERGGGPYWVYRSFSTFISARC